MVNQQKGVQQDTAYSAVVVNDHMYPRPCLYHFNMTLLGQKRYRDGDTYDHSLQRAYIAYACALAQTAPLLSRRLVTRPWCLFRESVGSL